MSLSRFPDGFAWGAATAAYQVEGAAYEDGRGLSIWDVFCKQPGRVEGGDSGDVACDHYHRYREDIALMKEIAVTTYRFSVSWPRVLPFGAGEVNEAGVDFYARLIDALLEAGIEPCATLYHWDLPQALQDRGGWADRDIAARFADYAGLIFERLGDRVHRFITLNEPLVFTHFGYRDGRMAPGIQDIVMAARAIHHAQLAHGRAVERYRDLGMRGEIGITNANTSYEPADGAPESAEAVDLARAFDTRLWHDPLFGRGYPQVVQRYYEERSAPFPVFEGDMATISLPIDFLGVNLYTRQRVRRDPDSSVGFSVERPILPTTPMGWERAPQALGDFVRFVSAEYGRPKIYVTENGVCDNTNLVDGRCDDPGRIELLAGFLAGLAEAIADGAADVRGYYVWSLLDNFEWYQGYSKRFGIVHVDYETQRRTPKASADWYRRVIAANAVEPV